MFSLIVFHSSLTRCRRKIYEEKSNVLLGIFQYFVIYWHILNFFPIVIDVLKFLNNYIYTYKLS